MVGVVKIMDTAIMQLTGSEEQLLPTLRQDLSIVASKPGEDGGPTWLLYDPIKNSYYRLGKIAFAMLSFWQNGVSITSWLKTLQSKEPDIEQSDIEQFLKFVVLQGLCLTSGPEDQSRLEAQRERQQKRGIKWILMRYLFIRIPILQPDHFLQSTLPYLNIFFNLRFQRCILLLGFIGLLLVLRQWDIFFATMLEFFNLSGAIFFILTLVFVKAFHEMGHAYTAKRQGCRVPTMGIALLVLYPFLYTDTTDAWKLTSRKQRLSIVTAGVKTELGLACIALFLWSFLDTGVLKSAAFFVATASLIASISINLSPFMRFDGYYALADWLGAENLQQRAFALARWRLRKLLFGLTSPPPEALPKQRQTIFLVYAYATWVYRFFLFLGIALLVYHLAFKVLGIILFIVELFFFIFLPIMSEFKIWWQERSNLRSNSHTLVTLFVLILGLVLLFLPWHSKISVPGVLETGKKTTVYPAEDAQISNIHVTNGQRVQKGSLLFTLFMPELEKQRDILISKRNYLKTRINRHIGSSSDLDQIDILQRELAKVNTDVEGVIRRIKRGEIKSPQRGYIAFLIDGHDGQWVSRESKLAQVVGFEKTDIKAYVEENQLYRIEPGASAFFFADSGDQPKRKAKVISLSTTAVATIDHPEVTSLFGGSIAVRQSNMNHLHPENGIYQITLRSDDSNSADISWRTAGQVSIDTAPTSPFSHLLRYAASVFIRESGL